MTKSDASANGCCLFPGSCGDPHDGFAVSSSFGTLVKLRGLGITFKVPGSLSETLASRSVWFIEDYAGWHSRSGFAQRMKYLVVPGWTVVDDENGCFPVGYAGEGRETSTSGCSRKLCSGMYMNRILGGLRRV
jgi:hypothetical protein